MLQREREIAQLREEVSGQAERIESLRNAMGEARAALVAVRSEREALQERVQPGPSARQRSAGRSGRVPVPHRASPHPQPRCRQGDRGAAQPEERRAGGIRGGSRPPAGGPGGHRAPERGTRERIGRQQALGSALEAAREQARSAQQAVHEFALQAESVRTGKAAIEENLARMRAQSMQLSGRRDELTGVLAQGDTPIVELEAELEMMLSQRREVETELSAARKQVEDIEHRVRELDQERVRKERSVGSRRDEVAQDRLAWQEIKVRSDTLLEQITGGGLRLPRSARDHRSAGQHRGLGGALGAGGAAHPATGADQPGGHRGVRRGVQTQGIPRCAARGPDRGAADAGKRHRQDRQGDARAFQGNLRQGRRGLPGAISRACSAAGRPTWN